MKKSDKKRGSNIKGGLIKALILAVFFAVVVLAVFYFTRREEEPETVYEGISDASLPVVYSLYDGERINRLYGYTVEMQEEYMRDDVTPLSANGQMTISVDCYDETLTGISYEVRDSDSGRLIESTEVTDWTEGGEPGAQTATAVLPIQRLIEEGREYLLRICLTTENHPAVYYYTRIVYNTELHVSEMIDFVTYFSERTLMEEEKQEGASELGLYIEPDSTGDNSSLAYVNIHSSHRMLTWMNLAPRRVGEPLVEIRQLDGSIGTLRLTYQVEAEGDSGRTETYDVEELFVVRWSELRFYLLAYERHANQQFVPDDTTISGGIVDLGVTEDGSTQLMTSDSGAYTVFTAGGELYSYNSSLNEAVRIFSFRGSGEDDVRVLHDEHGYQIIEVQDSGDVSFMTYGYMNSGSHEGEVAIVFYRYDSSERALQELFYIPSHASYSHLKQEMGKLSYISDTGLVYVMVSNSIYAIDVAGTEQVVVVDNLTEDSFVINDDNSMIAWQEGDDPYACTSLSVMRLSDGNVRTIQSSEGEYLRPLGFIGTDFIYGIARDTDIRTDISGRTAFPMYALEIVSEAGEVLTHYEPDSGHIMSVETGNGRIQVNCAYLSSSGQTVSEFSDVLLQNEPAGTNTSSVLTESQSELKRKVYSINLSSSADAERALTVQTPARLLDPSVNRVELSYSVERETDPRYYAYAFGELHDICYNLADAINAIYDDMGIVVDAGQNLVWARGAQSNQARISVNSACVTDREDMTLVPCIQALLFQQGVTADVSQMLSQGMSVREILNEALSGKAVDLTGCTLQQVLYFISEGNPVIVLTGETTAELMVGYDNYNITFYNPLDGTYYLMGRGDTAEYLEENGGYLFSSRS